MRTEAARAIVGAELQGEDPAAMATRWAAVLGRAAEPAGEAWRIGLDGGELRFVRAVDGRGEGLGCFDVMVRDANDVMSEARVRGCLGPDGVVLCGTRVRLVEG